MDLPYAETLNYWKTGKSDPNAFLTQTEQQIKKLGGEVHLVAKGQQDGRAAYCIEFTISPDRFRVVWPVLPVRQAKDQLAAERQAATLLYHDTKARAIRAAVFGSRSAFFEFLLLPDGRTAGQLAAPEMVNFSRLLND